LTGAPNGREALPGPIRGDFSRSNQENIIHASSSPEDAETEIRRFFRPEELFPRTPAATRFINSTDELGIPPVSRDPTARTKKHNHQLSIFLPEKN
ncbi:MAG: hypothetical protein K2O20_01945, partial [Duncaniella sp.]|nr:hypothetical protein [Duncaniella sp.]